MFFFGEERRRHSETLRIPESPISLVSHHLKLRRSFKRTKKSSTLERYSRYKTTPSTTVVAGNLLKENHLSGFSLWQPFLNFPKDHWTLKTGYFEDPTPASFRFFHPSIGGSKILRVPTKKNDPNRNPKPAPKRPVAFPSR